ncbi:Bromodomain-containing protein C631.02 [Durusdinium trenchii]|uniref:Bromodomain-containing protein C631.02 n=1 Tax=Durusdinium trenchii TaxID=1381693 RepID=A0ABP0QSR7_9DINO
MEFAAEFVNEPDWKDFEAYRVFVDEPLTLGMVQEQLEEERVTSVSTFLRKVRQVFVNALRYWRLHAAVRESAYILLDKFTELAWGTLPGLKEAAATNKLVDAAKLKVCRHSLDKLLAGLTLNLILPYNCPARADTQGFRDVIKDEHPLSLLEVVDRLNHMDYYAKAEDFHSDVHSVLRNWATFYRSREVRSDLLKATDNLIPNKKGASNKKLKAANLAKSATKSQSSFDKHMQSLVPLKPVEMQPAVPPAALPVDPGDIVKVNMNRVLSKVIEADKGFLLSVPVDWKALKLRDYPKTIKNPMDLGTMRLKVPGYPDMDAFDEDAELVFRNCNTYNQDPKNPVRVHARTVQRVYETLRRELVEPHLKQPPRKFDTSAIVAPVVKAKFVAAPPVRAAATAGANKDKDKRADAAASSPVHAGGSSRAAAAAAAPKSFPEAKQCMNVINSVLKRPKAIWFSEPVKWEELQLFDYPQVVKHPMDLGTVRKKLEQGQYRDLKEFQSDVGLVFSNCRTYNKQESKEFPILTWCAKLESEFEKKMRDKVFAKSERASTGAQPQAPGSSFPKKLCKDVLEEFMRLPAAKGFLKPVTLPGYRDVIERPMDLKTVQSNVKSSRYTSHEDFARDVRLVFDNAIKFNTTDNGALSIRKFATELKETFEQEYQTRVVEVLEKKRAAAEAKAQSPGGKAAVSPVSSESSPVPPSRTSSPAGTAEADKKKKKKKQKKNDGKEDSSSPATARSPSETLQKVPSLKIKLSGFSTKTLAPKKEGGKRKLEDVSLPVEHKKQKSSRPGLHFEAPEEPNRALLLFEASSQRAILKVARTEWGKLYFGRPVLETYPDLAQAYLAVISKPMDLRTMLQKLYAGDAYNSSYDVDDDAQTMFANALKFNVDDGQLMTKHIRQHFEHVRSFWNFLVEECTDRKEAERNDKRKEREALLAEEELSGCTSSVNKLIRKLMAPRNKDCVPFLDPVNVRQFPDYLSVVRQPMDLKTVKDKVARKDYDEPGGLILFATHMRLIFSNCLLYNRAEVPTNAVIRGMAERMADLFESEWAVVTCEALEKVRRVKLLREQDVERQVQARLEQLENHTEEDAARIKAEIVEELDVEAERRRQETKDQFKASIGGPRSDDFIYGSGVEDEDDKDDDVDHDPTLDVDVSDESDYDPETRRNRNRNRGGGGGARSSGVGTGGFHAYVPHHAPAVFLDHEPKQRSQPDIVEYKRYLADVERAKKQSLKRAEEIDQERKAQLERAKRRQEREKERERQRMQESNLCALSSDEMERARGLSFKIHPLNKSKTRRRRRTVRKDAMEMEIDNDEDDDGLVDDPSAAERWRKAVLERQARVDKTGQQVDSDVEMSAEGRNDPAGSDAPADDDVVALKCRVPRRVRRNAESQIVVGTPGTPGSFRGVGTPGTPGASRVKGRKLGKGKTLNLLKNVAKPTTTVRVSQRIIELNSLQVCFGMVVMTLTTPEEDFRRQDDDDAQQAQQYGTCEVLKRDGDPFEGLSPPSYVPVTAEQREKPAVPYTIRFRVGAISPDEEAAFKLALQTIIHTPNIWDQGNLDLLAPPVMVARRFVAKCPESVSFPGAPADLDDDDVSGGGDDYDAVLSQQRGGLSGLLQDALPASRKALQSWSLNSRHCLMTCDPEIQERGSRPYVVLRYVGLPHKLSIEVANLAAQTPK